MKLKRLHMKKIYLIIVLISLASCNKWLDITPQLEIRKDLMFENEQGFKDVLTGAYIRMARPALYGLNTTIVLPELMSQHWKPVSNTLSDYLSAFNFEETESKNLLETVWLQYFQTIVNLNSLLEELENKKDLVTPENYRLIKGEAIGLRAFLHFEVLRFWSDVPQNTVASNSAIPYVKEVTKDPNKLVSISYQEVMANILADLESAEGLLDADPILEYSNDVLNSPATLAGIDQTKPHPSDDFHYFRQVRFNYYAVKATKARLYLWTGDKTLALENALEVIGAQNGDGTRKFTLGSETAANNGQLTFPTEHVFAVSNTMATQTLTPVFFNDRTAYTQTTTYLNTAFESSLHTADIRYKNNRVWETRLVPMVGDFNFFKKYNSTDSKTAVTDMPLIRLAEMYFIAAECGNTDLFRDYRIARALDASIDGSMNTPEEVMARLEKEYRKEFYGEGQMFFFYKRLNYSLFTWPVAKVVLPENYKLPLPQSQQMFE